MAATSPINSVGAERLRGATVVAGLAHYTRFGFAMKPTAWSKFSGGGGDENITINHGFGGGDCGGSGNIDGNRDGDGGGGSDSGGRESNGGIGGGRGDAALSDDDDDDNDDVALDRKSTRLNSSHTPVSRMPSSA